MGHACRPKRVDIPILHQDDADGWIDPPIGILQLKVLICITDKHAYLFRLMS